jgi:zinc and cadmium transporter
MHEAILISLYSVAVVASSLLGGWLPSLFRLTHVRMQIMLSFVGGMMLGVGVLHMLPHSFVETGSLDTSLNWMLFGLLGMFLLIRTFHFHEHGTAGNPDLPADAVEGQHACAHDHPGHAAHDHAHATAAPRAQGGWDGAAGVSALSWVGVAFGLSLHAFLDGIALGAGVISDMQHRGEVPLAGLGVFLAVLLHKPLDALSITSLMQARGWSRRSQQIVNAGFAMMCPLGAWAFALVVRTTGSAQPHWVGVALAISAGVFLCISLSDLLPEVQFHRHDRLKLSAALVIGVLLAYAIHLFEPAHAHDMRPEIEAVEGHVH